MQREKERQTEGGRERVGVCKGVSSGGKWPRLPRRCSQTIPFHHRRVGSYHHYHTRPPLSPGCSPPSTAVSSSSVETPSLTPFRERAPPLHHSPPPRIPTVYVPLYRRQRPCATRFSILASCDCKLRPFALFYTTESRINKFSGNAEKFI